MLSQQSTYYPSVLITLSISSNKVHSIQAESDDNVDWMLLRYRKTISIPGSQDHVDP